MHPHYPFTVEQFKRYFSEFGSPGALIGGWLCALLSLIANHAYLSPPLWKALGGLAALLIVLDVITGVIRSSCVHQPKHSAADPRCNKFNSRDLGSTFVKIIVYGIMFLVGTGIDVAVNTAFSIAIDSRSYAIAMSMLGAMCFRELFSNFENCRDIWRKRVGEEWPFDGIQEKAIGVLEDLIAKEKTVSGQSSPEEVVDNQGTDV